MMTLFSRGRGPMMSRSSSADLSLWRYRSSNWTSMTTSGALLAEVVEPGLGRLRDPVGVPQRRVAPAFDIDQHPAHAVLEADGRLPAQPRDDLGDIGEGAVGLARALGDVHDLAAEKLDQTIDRLRIAGANVEAR